MLDPHCERPFVHRSSWWLRSTPFHFLVVEFGPDNRNLQSIGTHSYLVGKIRSVLMYSSTTRQANSESHCRKPTHKRRDRRIRGAKEKISTRLDLGKMCVFHSERENKDETQLTMNIRSKRPKCGHGIELEERRSFESIRSRWRTLEAVSSYFGDDGTGSGCE